MSRRNNRNNRNGNRNGSRNNSNDACGTAQNASGANETNEYGSRKPNITKLADVIGRENDPTWYKDPLGIVKDAAQISWFSPSGAPLSPQEPYLLYNNMSTTPNGKSGTASVMTADMWLSPGYADSPNDAVNIAANELFMRMRKSLTTTATYAPADVMMYILGIDSIISAWCDISRQFGILPMYSGVNLNFPNTLYGAISDDATMAFDTDNYNQLRSKFNLIVGKANTLFAPLMTPIQTRHMWMFSNVFLDSRTSWSQMYVFKLKMVYMLDEKSMLTGTALKPIAWPANLSAKIKLFGEMVETYRNSDSMIRINADLRKAFDNVNELKFDLVPEGYVQELTFSEEVLNQFHNMEVTIVTPDIEAPAPEPTEFKDASFVSPWVVQDVNHNCLIYRPGLGVTSSTVLHPKQLSLAKSSYIVDSSMESPDLDDILVNTRLIVPYDVSPLYSDQCEAAFILRPVSDFCTGLSTYTRVVLDDGGVTTNVATLGPRNDVGLEATVLPLDKQFSRLAAFTSFYKAPQIKYSTTQSTIWDDFSQVVRRIWQTDHMGLISADQMKILNNAITLAMWRLDDILQ